MKKFFSNIGFNFAFLIGVAVVLAVVFYIVWNAAIIWILPFMPYLKFVNALGLAGLYLLIQMFINYWINRFIQIRSARALEALFIVEKLNLEMAVVMKTLKNKGIL